MSLSLSLTLLFLALSFIFLAIIVIIKKDRELFKKQFEVEQLNGRLKEFEDLKKENLELRDSRTALVASIEEERRHFNDKIEFVEKAKRDLGDLFKNLSSEVFQANSKRFIELAEQNFIKHSELSNMAMDKRKLEIGGLLQPITDSLKSFDSKVSQLEIARISAYSGILEQFKIQQENIAKLNLETNSLVKALHSSSTRGSWGEIQLKRVVELAGMLPYCDFIEQEYSDRNGSRSRPDMVIKLPNHKNVVVDAKAPLKAYLEALDISDEAQKKLKFKEHAKQVRLHIQTLSNKAYWEQFQPTPEFVIIFLPGESYFSTAVENDPSLLEYGVDKNVILSTPSSLIALLKAVAYGWKQEKLALNAIEVRDLGQNLYDRVLTLTKYFVDLRKGIESSVFAYNKAVGAIENRVLVTARRFRDLGAASGDDIVQLESVESGLKELSKLE